MNIRDFWIGYLMGALSMLVLTVLDPDGTPGLGHAILLGLPALNILAAWIVNRGTRRGAR